MTLAPYVASFWIQIQLTQSELKLQLIFSVMHYFFSFLIVR